MRAWHRLGRGWLQGMRALVRGEGLLRPAERVVVPELRLLERDLRELMRDVRTEFRTHDQDQIVWSPEALRNILRELPHGEDVIVVSNREPYIHARRDGRIEVQRPASGLVTALEPVMRACSGTWIAHGSGLADRVASTATLVRRPADTRRPTYAPRSARC